jgi:hypothetical protein
MALPFVKPASLIISTISKPDFLKGSLANNFVAKPVTSLFISPLCRNFTLHTLIHTSPLETKLQYLGLTKTIALMKMSGDNPESSSQLSKSSSVQNSLHRQMSRIYEQARF